MRALTNSVGTGGSLALAFKLLSWAERSDQLIFPAIAQWRFDGASFIAGLFTGLLIYFLAELWFTAKLVVFAWVDRAPAERIARPRALQKPLYKLC